MGAWRNEALPGELAQELPVPAHFEQATQLVTEEMVGEAFSCGPDPEKHLQQLQAYAQAGYDESCRCAMVTSRRRGQGCHAPGALPGRQNEFGLQTIIGSGCYIVAALRLREVICAG